MASIEFPSTDEWRILNTASPFNALSRKVIEYSQKQKPINDFWELGSIVETDELYWQLHYRIADVSKSYSLLNYYFSKGIPDDEWFISPGKQSDSSIEYYPHFQAIHYFIKDWFDFYSDAYYHKLFSAFDSIGHILHVRYGLSGDRNAVTFHRVMNALKTVDNLLYTQLDLIRQDAAFLEANRLRNDITHNRLPHSAGLSVRWDMLGPKVRGFSVGVGKYTTSKEIMNNIQAMAVLFERILNHITV